MSGMREPTGRRATSNGRGRRWLADLAHDVRYGFRSLRHTRVFTTVALLTLALAIGANTAIFSLLDVLVLRDLPVREPANLVQFLWTYPGDPPLNMFSARAYEQYRTQNHGFTDMLGAASVRVEAKTIGGPAETLGVECVTANFFDSLGVRSATGRLLGAQDHQPSAPAVAVASWSYWNERFNRQSEILGADVTLLGMPVTVVGVAEQDFFGLAVGSTPDIWIPASVCERKGPIMLALMARLKDGVTIERAQAEMRVLDRPRIEEFARRDPKWRETRLDVLPGRAGFSTPLHQQFARPLWMLLAVVAVLLVLACTNIGSLLLARGAQRQREMAVRVSLGAGRFRLVRQMLTESLLLAIAGGVLGTVAAYIGAGALLRIMISGTRMLGVPPRLEAVIDARMLLFTMATMMAAAVLFGLVPALSAFVSDPAATLRQGAGGGLPRSRRLFANGLVVAQVALCVVLLTVSGMFVGHLTSLRDVKSLGFDPTSALLVKLDVARPGPSRDALIARYQELLSRFESIPGVRSATLSAMTPISGAAGSRFVTVEGFQEAPDGRRRLELNAVAPRYFETLRTPLVSGRDFRPTDVGTARVAIVNQAMARYYFDGRDPLGSHLRFDDEAQPYEIIGVVADAKYSDVRTPAPRTVYLHLFQENRLPSAEFTIRTTGPATSIMGDVRRITAEVQGAMPISNVTTLTEQVDASIVPERLIATLSSVFGVLGMLLAALGLYGLLAYTVARRTRDIGLQRAFGAREQDVIFGVLKSTFALVGAGLLAGGPIALWSARVAASIVGNMPATSPMAIAIAALATIAVALLASYVPVRRATRVDPLTALRSE